MAVRATRKRTAKSAGRKRGSRAGTAPASPVAEDGCEAQPQDAAEEKPQRVRNLKKFAQGRIHQSFAKIVDGLVTQATGGKLGHTKYLFELGGVKEEIAKQGRGRRKEPSLGKLLLEELAKRNEAQPGEKDVEPEAPAGE